MTHPTSRAAAGECTSRALDPDGKVLWATEFAAGRLPRVSLLGCRAAQLISTTYKPMSIQQSSQLKELCVKFLS